MKNNEISKKRYQVLWEANIRTIPSLMKYVKISRATTCRYAKQMAEHGSIKRKRDQVVIISHKNKWKESDKEGQRNQETT